MKWSEMENKPKAYRIIRDLIRYLKTQEEKPSVNEIDEAWNSVSRKIAEDANRSAKRRSWAIISVSAVAVILIGLVIGITIPSVNPDDISEIASELSKITVPDDEIKLVVSSNEILPVKKNATVTYSSDGAIVVDEETVLPQTGEDKDIDTSNQYNQLIVPKGRYTQLQLADGSKLHVNSGTKVVYPRVFKKNRREIFVDGEIFIDVKRNESSPFIVKTDNFEIEVLGTTFNVNAYSEDSESEVVLVHGSINIKDKSNKKIELVPNDLATIRTGKIQHKRTVDVYNYIAWTDGWLVLDAAPLGSVFQRLERYYGFKIIFEPSVKDLQIYGSLELDQSLPEVLRRLAVTAPIYYQEKESGFYIRKRE